MSLDSISIKDLLLKLPSICQCCAIENIKLKSMKNCHFDQCGQNYVYYDILKECFNVTLETQEFMEDLMICDDCIIKLRESYQFKQQITNSQNKLQNIIKKWNEYNDKDDVDIKHEDVWFNDIKEEDSCDFQDIKSCDDDDDEDESLLFVHNQIKENVKREKSKNANKTNEILQKAIERTQNNLKLLKESSIEFEFLEKQLKNCQNNDLNSEKSEEEKVRRKREIQKTWRKRREPYNLDPTATDCYICKEAFSSHALLISHMATHFPNWICADCGKVFASVLHMKNHVRSMHRKNEALCPVCSRVVKKGSLKRHIETHKGHVKPNKCKFCDERFASHRRREIHMHEEHGTAERKHICNMCNKEYGTAGTLTQHIKKFHLCMKPHECPECSKSFFSKSDLRNHMVTHTKERNFKCSECPKTYATRSALVTHIKKYH